MRDRREKRFAVASVDGDDGMSAIGRTKYDELSATICFPSKERAHNALLSHRPVVGLNADPAVGQRNEVKPILEQGVDDLGLGWKETG